ncbi:MAG: hypothetical protein ACI8W8_001832, partial [Rhodothermales bacterium]
TLLLVTLYFVGCGGQEQTTTATDPAPVEGSNAHDAAEIAPAEGSNAAESVEAAATDAAKAVETEAAATQVEVQKVVGEVAAVVADVAAAADVEAMIAAAQKHLAAGKLDELTASLSKLGKMELNDEQKTLLQTLIDGAKKLGAAALAGQLTNGTTDGATPDAEAVKGAAADALKGAFGLPKGQ